MKRIILSSIIVCITLSCIKKAPEFQQILLIESNRQPCEKLIPYLDYTEPQVRRRAIEAFGKIQDSTCIDVIARMLDDINHNVRLEAAFALGQIGNSQAEPYLLSHIKNKDMVKVKRRVIEAIGKIGTEQSVPVLIKLFKSYESKIRAEAALTAGRLALRNLIFQTLTDSLSQLLKDSNANVRWKTAYALMRIGKNLNPNSLTEALQDKDARVRMYATEALSNLQDYAFVEPLGDRLLHDSEWRVRVKAANGLGKFKLTLSANYLSLLNQIQPVRVAVIQAIGNAALLEEEGYQQNKRELNFAKNQLEEVLLPGQSTRKWTSPEKGFALIAYAQLMREKGLDLIEAYLSHPNSKVRARAAEALGETRSSKVVDLLGTAFDDSVAIVKVKTLEALTKINNRKTSDIYIRALQDSDHVLVALAAQGLSQDSLKNKIYAKRIVEAYQKLPKPVDAESAQMIFAALAKFKEKQAIPVLHEALDTDDIAVFNAAASAIRTIVGDDSVVAKSKVKANDLDFNLNTIYALQGVKALIKTTRGDIVLRLNPMDAPLTVLNFVNLSQRGFYNNLSFHRVVPNFVVQGGDPRGDSWGSPGYSIKSEFNKQPYLRGTVGMASAGKDTEGCQFFITHSPQPHLDGRYTVFGRVVSGMDVVDKIQEGDIIEKIAILE